ncbi:MAG: alpha-glucuronidase family glycosyl hydrolase, partial [Planctomycetota bacterium]|nr:alpha-glucuronidase family glycosyl hydrolase [Planctomycetota bacterium]
MSRFQILNAVLAMMSSFHPLSADWELVKHGRSLFEIRLREGPSAAELYAAEELRDHIEKMTGARLPLKTARNFPQSVLLISRPDDAGVRADSKALADESYQLLVDDRRVVIRGGSPRGQLYGVYSFLERL